MVIPNWVRYFNKRFLNRAMMKIAGIPHSPIAVVRHVGRRSGRPYATPVIIEPTPEGFVFALTYGPGVDWYRNVLAAGLCVVRWHGKEYIIEKPTPLDAPSALAAFPQPFRPILRLVGIQNFFKMSRKENLNHDP